MPRKTVVKSRCALCGAKDVSEPRGEEKYCRDCWDKKIAVEEIVAREFALKRYIRAHSAEKYLIYHSTLKRPCGQLIVVDDGYDLFLTLMLYPNFGWDEPGLSPRGRPRRPAVLGTARRRRRRRGHRAVGRRQMAHGNLPLGQPRARGLERGDVSIMPAEVGRQAEAETGLNAKSHGSMVEAQSCACPFMTFVARVPEVAMPRRARSPLTPRRACRPRARPTPQAPPMTSVLAGKKFTPPIKGEADVDFTKPVTKRDRQTWSSRRFR